MFPPILSCLLSVNAVQQSPVTIPPFASWDGKTWAGVAVGTSENDLGKQVAKSKTVGPDPASVRIAADRKGWILAAILTATDNKGSVCGFTVDLEKDEPIESLEMLQGELGPPDAVAYAPTRFSDWSVAVWVGKGIAAAIQNGSRPLVKKLLLAPPAVLTKSLDLWQRDPNVIQQAPSLPVAGFDVSVSSDPKDRGIEDELGERVRRLARRQMEGGGGNGWTASPGQGARIRVSMQVSHKTSILASGSVSVSYQDPLGTVSVTSTGSSAVDQGTSLRDVAESLYDNVENTFWQEVAKKYQRLAWQTEWRQFTSLCRPRP